MLAVVQPANRFASSTDPSLSPFSLCCFTLAPARSPIPNWQVIVDAWLHLPIPDWYLHFLWLHPEHTQQLGQQSEPQPQAAGQQQEGKQQPEQQGQGGQQGRRGGDGEGWGPPPTPEQRQRQREYAAYGMVEEDDWLVGAREHGLMPWRLYPRRWVVGEAVMSLGLVNGVPVWPCAAACANRGNKM